jgi:hypothetical protein
VAWFIRWSPDGSIGIEGNFIALAIDLCLPFFLIDLEYLFEFNESSIPWIQFGDEFTELKLFKVDVKSLKHCFEIVHAHEAVALFVEVLEGTPAVAHVSLS